MGLKLHQVARLGKNANWATFAKRWFPKMLHWLLANFETMAGDHFQ